MNTPSKSRSGSSLCLDGDRFIPSRSGMDIDMANFKLTCKENNPNANNPLLQSPSREHYKSTLASSLFDSNSDNLGSKVLAFSHKAPAPPENYQNHLRVLYSQNSTKSSTSSSCAAPASPRRTIPQQPERILDAPEFVDDYYLNLLDWSSSNLLAIALGQTVYLWNASSGSITELMHTEGDENPITSVSFITGGSYLAVGTTDAEIQLWDIEKSRQVRAMGGHSARVSSLAWNQFILSSGSKDTSIFNHDVRIASHHVSSFLGHQQEVCGLKWSLDGTQLASGGNDNLLKIWKNGQETSQFTFDQHQAAVKALAWCPWQPNLLASGGGTSDRCIKFWNTATGACLNSVDTRSQVCALQWSTTYRELISSHGYSQNQLCVWKYPTMTKVAELHGHTSRVLHLALSPDGQTVVSAAGDERLRFWNVWPAKRPKVASTSSVVKSGVNRKGSHRAIDIR